MSSLTIESAPQVALKGPMVVVNFSSPHPFKFETGETLLGCSPDRCTHLSLLDQDEERPHPSIGHVVLVSKKFVMTPAVLQELTDLQDNDNIDVVLVSFPILQAIAALGLAQQFSKAATVKVDRLTKLISPTHFCV